MLPLPLELFHSAFYLISKARSDKFRRTINFKTTKSFQTPKNKVLTEDKLQRIVGNEKIKKTEALFTLNKNFFFFCCKNTTNLSDKSCTSTNNFLAIKLQSVVKKKRKKENFTLKLKFLA